MKEEFLYYIWANRRWSGKLLTSSGKTVDVIFPGLRNSNSGPDFLNAKIIIDRVLWVGNVEIHVNSSDWLLHGHQNDSNYSNIILHLVYNNDITESLGNFPILEFYNNIPEDLVQNYKDLEQNYAFIPCEKSFHQVEASFKRYFYQSLYVERLIDKSEIWRNRLELLKGDWESLLYEGLFYGFGLKVNAEPFHLLAKSIPFKVVREIRRKDESLEALFMGMAGFLEQTQDTYQKELWIKFNYIKHKYKLIPLDKGLFKFLRMRPSNFPTIRLAQLAALLEHKDIWFNQLVKEGNYKKSVQEMSHIVPTMYWENHYTFNKASKAKRKVITISLIDVIYANVIIPIKFLYNLQNDQDLETLIDFTSNMKNESNSIISSYYALDNLKVNMAEGQGLLQLKKKYCDKKNCLSCSIGNQILKK